MRSISTLTLFTAAILSASACVEPDDPLDEEVETTAAAIVDGSPATAFQRARAADLRGCTGTLIAPRFVLTALHCVCRRNPDTGVCTSQLNSTVRFYLGGPDSENTTTMNRTVVAIHRPPGTLWNTDNEDWTDSDGDFADLAIFELNARAPSTSTVATLAWSYPGSDRLGTKVGAGNHGGNSNPDGILLQRSDYTYSDDASGGGFLTNQAGVDKGDSGGPYYYGSRVLGTLTGWILDGVLRGRHTSVPHHLDWILGVIDYDWAGDPVQFGVMRVGAFSAFLGVRSRPVCAYACEKTATCAAYNWHPVLGCQQLSSVTQSVAATGWASATR